MRSRPQKGITPPFFAPTTEGSMALVNYPDSFPAESIGYVVAVIRKQEPLDKAKLGHHGWCAQGYLQKLLLGEPDTEAILGPLSIDAETVAVALESLNPEGPQAILGGNLTKKLLLMMLMRLVEGALGGIDLPETLEKMIDEILGSLLGIE